VAGLPKKDVLYAYRVDGAGGWETGYRYNQPYHCVAFEPMPLQRSFSGNAIRTSFAKHEFYGCRWTPERLLLDPYAKHVSSRKQWATRDDREQYETDVRIRNGFDINVDDGHPFSSGLPADSSQELQWKA
jgi:hypothetical protein